VAGIAVGLLILGALAMAITGIILLVALLKGASSGLFIVGAIIAALALAGARSGAVIIGRAIPDIQERIVEQATQNRLNVTYFGTALAWTFVLGFCAGGIGFVVFMNIHYQL